LAKTKLDEMQFNPPKNINPETNLFLDTDYYASVTKTEQISPTTQMVSSHPPHLKKPNSSKNKKC
jgi:hypothetical protein